MNSKACILIHYDENASFIKKILLFFILSTERSYWPAFHMKKYLKDINSPWKDEQGDIFLFKKKCFVQNQNVLEWEQ